MTVPESADASIDEDARRRFESAWRQRQPVSIEACVPAPEDPRYLATLEELVLIELEFVWKADLGSARPAGVFVEQYLSRFPGLNTPVVVRRLLEQECLVRSRCGCPPKPGEYRARFPALSIRDYEVEQAATVLAALAESASPAKLPGAAQLGRYQLCGEQGRGGFGLVWRARDERLGREVALKQLGSASSVPLRQRFLSEARIAAQLEHPGIVPVYELGDDAAQPYYTMKLVRGRTLSNAIASHHQQSSHAGERAVQRLQLISAFLGVTRAIAFAHSRGVIHRDLKPDNVILGDYGETVVLDWGLARARRNSGSENVGCVADDAGSISPNLTQQGTVLGTPAYMSPEQAAGQTDELDERSDIYSLGAILYEILVGRRAFIGKSSDEVLRQVLSHEPVRPRALNRNIPPALEAICLKAMARPKTQRYADATALAEDVERFVAGEAVHAHPESWLPRLARRARRHRGLVAVGIAALILLTAVSLCAALLIQAEQQRTAEALTQARWNLYLNSLSLAQREWADGHVRQSQDILEQCPEEFRAWEWFFSKRLCHDELLTVAAARPLALDVFTADGKTLAIISEDNSDTPQTMLQWVDAVTGEVLDSQQQPGRALSRLSANGCVALAEFGPATANLRLWNMAKRQVAASFSIPAESVTVAISSGGRWLATSGIDGVLRVWDAGGREVRRLPDNARGMRVFDLLFHPKQADQLVCSNGGQISLWDVVSGQSRQTISTDDTADVDSMAFNAAGDRLYWTEWERHTRVGGLKTWSAAPDAVPELLSSLSVRAHCVAVDSTEKWLALGCVDHSIRLWNLEDGRDVRILRGHDAGVNAVTFSPDGQRLISASSDGTVKVWDTARPQGLQRLRDRVGAIPGVRFERAAVQPLCPPISSDAVDKHYRFLQGKAGLADVRDGAGTAAGDRLAFIVTHEQQDWLVLWDCQRQGEVFSYAAPEGTLNQPLFSPDGALLAVAAPDMALIFDAQSGTERQRLKPGGEGCFRLAFSADAKLLATSGRSGVIHIWDALAGTLRVTLSGDAGPLHCLVFSPDGNTVVAGGRNSELRFWDWPTATSAHVLKLPGDEAYSAAYTPDGRRLVTASTANRKSPTTTLQVWDTTSLQEVFRLATLDDVVAQLTFSPDGRCLVGLSGGDLLIWDSHWLQNPAP